MAWINKTRLSLRGGLVWRKCAQMIEKFRRLKTVRVLFWITASGVLLLAQISSSVSTPTPTGGLKAHFIAFYVLSLLGATAFPKSHLLVLGCALAVFGGIVEVMQAVLPFGRHPSLFDWLIDLVGIAVACVPFAFSELRRQIGNTSNNSF